MSCPVSRIGVPSSSSEAKARASACAQSMAVEISAVLLEEALELGVRREALGGLE